VSCIATVCALCCWLLAARVLVCQNQFQASGAPAVDAALTDLRLLRTELSEAVGSFGPDGKNPEVWATHYDDGRPVISAMPIGQGLYVHVWPVDPTHPMNSRCELDVITTPDGAPKQMIVSAPGVIDAVSLPEVGAAGDGQPVPARTASKED
jgi:hypothetical protein